MGDGVLMADIELGVHFIVIDLLCLHAIFEVNLIIFDDLKQFEFWVRVRIHFLRAKTSSVMSIHCS